MRRPETWPLFVAVSGEGENASVVTTMSAARAWLRVQFYGTDKVFAADLANDELDRWAHFKDPRNWSACGDGLEYEYSGWNEDCATIRAFFVTEVA